MGDLNQSEYRKELKEWRNEFIQSLKKDGKEEEEIDYILQKIKKENLLKLRNLSDINLNAYKIDYKEIEKFLGNDNEIGKGGFSNVYKGKWNNLPVAIKKIEKSLDSKKEIETLLKLNHPNILKCYGVNIIIIII